MVNVELNFGGNPFAHVLIFWKFSVTDTKTGYHRFHGIDRFFLFLHLRHAVKVKVCCWWVSELPISSVSARARRSVPVSVNPTTQGSESHNFATSSMSSTQIDYLGVAFSRMVTHWTMKCCCTIVSYDLRLATDFQPACWRDIALQISWGLDAKHCVCYLAANAKFTRAGRFPANPPFQQLAA